MPSTLPDRLTRRYSLGIKKRCEHGKTSHCIKCGGVSVCEHRRLKWLCRECKGSQICIHGRQKAYCIECGGSQICKHRKQRRYCRDCEAKRICPHTVDSSKCKLCGGKPLCVHGLMRYLCRECKGNGICQHNHQRTKCKKCGGIEVWANELANSAKARSKRLGLPYTLSNEWIVQRLKDGCPVFGWAFEFGDKVVTPKSATIDKFNPLLGYTPENSFVISKLANTIKNEANVEQVFKVANWMESVERENYNNEYLG